VATKLENLGLKPFLQHRCDWNDTIIRQFYATYEMDFEAKNIKWMTGKSEYEASFAEFAAANYLNYEYFSDGVDVYNEDILDNIAVFYEPGTSNATIMNWLAAGLRHHPAIINNIIRHTFMPKSRNKGKVREHYWNVINHIMHETRFDVVKLILDQMICKKHLVRDSIYFSPYIMSFIKTKTGFNGLCDVKHEIYRPFYNAKAFLNKPLTPYGQAAEAQNVAENVEVHASDDENANVGNMGHANVDEDAYAMPPPPPPVHPMQPQWEPPAGYFDSYFANFQQSMNSQFQQMQSGFNSHFKAYEQQMNNTFQTMQQGFQQQSDASLDSFGHHRYNTMHDPMMQRLSDMQTDLQNNLSALNDRFSQMSTSEQY
jgi:hypothetical protein